MLATPALGGEAHFRRLLKDEKPGDLPVQHATKVAQTRLNVPNALIGRANEVIE
jgi:hypothetical protein